MFLLFRCSTLFLLILLLRRNSSESKICVSILKSFMMGESNAEDLWFAGLRPMICRFEALNGAMVGGAISQQFAFLSLRSLQRIIQRSFKDNMNQDQSFLFTHTYIYIYIYKCIYIYIYNIHNIHIYKIHILYNIHIIYATSCVAYFLCNTYNTQFYYSTSQDDERKLVVRLQILEPRIRPTSCQLAVNWNLWRRRV